MVIIQHDVQYYMVLFIIYIVIQQFLIFFLDISVSYVQRNLSNGDVITISSFIGTIVMPVKVFDGKTCM